MKKSLRQVGLYPFSGSLPRQRAAAPPGSGGRAGGGRL